MLYKPAFCLAAALCLVVTIAHAQSADSVVQKVANFPVKVFNKITGKTTDLQQQLTRQTEKYLRRMARKEQRLRASLYKTDSAKAAALYPQDPGLKYAALLQTFRQDSAKVFSSMGPEYLPRVDSLQGALSFLSKNPGVLNAGPDLETKMQTSLASMQQLQAKLQDADAIKAFIQSRKAQHEEEPSRKTNRLRCRSHAGRNCLSS
jgi:hypothetical protein